MQHRAGAGTGPWAAWGGDGANDPPGEEPEWLTVMKMGASNSSAGDSKTLKKKVCGVEGKGLSTSTLCKQPWGWGTPRGAKVSAWCSSGCSQTPAPELCRCLRSGPDPQSSPQALPKPTPRPHLVEEGAVAFADPGPPGLPRDRHLHHGLDVNPGQLPALDHPHPDLQQEGEKGKSSAGSRGGHRALPRYPTGDAPAPGTPKRDPKEGCTKTQVPQEGCTQTCPRLTWKSCGLLDRGFLGELLLRLTPWTWCTGGLRGSEGGSDPGGPEGAGSVSSPVAGRSSASSSSVGASARGRGQGGC